MASLGFDQLIFSLMTDHKHIDREAGHGIMLNYAEDWMKYYVQKNYVDHDPVRRQMFTSPGSFVWEDVTKLPTLTNTQQVLMNEASDAGMKEGIGVPLRGPRGALAGVGAASSSGGVGLENKNLLSYVTLLSQQFYTVYLSIEKMRLSDEQQLVFLTDREQEILQWCARGKTRTEVAERLSLTDSTVDFHIKNALKKLDASNITLGVLKALNRGLIQL